MNVVDVGTSLVHASVARPDFTMATMIETLADIFQAHGVLPRLTFDRDPRFVGSHSGRDFPGPFLRFLYGLNVEVNICPPHRPDLNSHVERFHQNLGRECLDIEKPADLAAVRELLPPFIRHYNEERPNQAVTCGNRPPRVAFPDLPALASVPVLVNPDAWLRVCDGRVYARTVNANGSIQVGEQRYYIDKTWAGRRVVVHVDAAAQELAVEATGKAVKRRKIKGLFAREMGFEAFVTAMKTAATSLQKRTRTAA